MGLRRACISITLMLLMPLSSPTVLAEWNSDNWLENVIGPERLENGDEFGCHGYQGIDTNKENWVIEACRDYLMERTDASKWGKNPISFGFEGNSLDATTTEALIQSGFQIVGNGIIDSPAKLTPFHSNDVSLEKGASGQSILEYAEEDSLISIYWRARIDDLRLREDKDLIDWLEDQEYWFTTWGEWYHHNISSNEIARKAVIDGRKITLNLTSSDGWQVPGTVSISFNGTVLGVTDSEGNNFDTILSSDKRLKSGWREYNGSVLVTLGRGQAITIEFESEQNNQEIIPQKMFNGLQKSVTIVGHHTTNLFQWSSDFQDSDLRFTWLIERPASEELGLTLPLLALAVLIAIPVSISYFVKRDEFNSDIS